ncbi:Pga56 protein [Candida orthopsilosis Co 90-125]|uniref:Pga56 protein n=1 Tax=Candida orthopsilosis (strain 90-125) TaxID=1136231 RepID=H8X7Z9_CANO9|nr:Pga56 protein [Candida orthopsilosis Co 90-125]CCG24098.1 Pga56 protein [Candida orthopsilosis Co 90-125]
MQFTQIIASLALVGSIQAKFHNTTGGAVSNSTGGAGSNSTGGAGSNSTGGAGGSNSTGGSGSSSDNAANANANIYGGAALVAAAVALLY